MSLPLQVVVFDGGEARALAGEMNAALQVCHLNCDVVAIVNSRSST